jgi:hypothetical protein
MKAILFGLLLTIAASPLFAQSDTDTDFGKLAISVVVPQELAGFSAENLSMLETKLTVLLSNNGLASRGIEDGIVLYPMLKIYNEREIQPGMQKLTVIDGELSLFVKQTGDKFIFASTTKRVQGSGRTHTLAINNIISAIKTDDPAFSTFIEKAKAKALAYYTQRCPQILSQAEQLASVGKQGQAYNMIMGIPAEVPCYEQGKKKAIDIFLKYQARNCAEIVQNAKAKFGINQYKEGFDILKTLDPTAPCNADANALFNQHSAEFDEMVKREWELRKTIIQNAFELEKFRYKAITDMTLLYLTTLPRRYEYDILIR